MLLPLHISFVMWDGTSSGLKEILQHDALCKPPLALLQDPCVDVSHPRFSTAGV